MMPDASQKHVIESVAIPDEWRTVSISEITKCRGGIGFPPGLQGQTEGKYPFYKVSDMNLPGNSWSMTLANNYVDDDVIAKLKAKTFPKGTIIFPKVGAAIATNKKRMITTDSLVDNNVMGVVVTSPKTCLPDYLLCYFIGLDLKTISNAGPLPSINSAAVNELQVPLPPPPEQRSITYVLAKIQEAITAQQEIIDRTRELKKALMAKLFTEGLRGEPLKETKIGPVPESWEVKPFGELVDIANGQVDPKVLPYSEMIHVGPEDIEEGTGRILQKRIACDLGLISGKYEFSSEDIIYSKIRPYLMKAAMTDFPGICSADMYPVRPKKKVLERAYLFQYLLSDIFTRQATSNQQRTGIPKINRNQLNAILVPRPKFEEQVEIGEALCSYDNKLDVALQKRAALSDLFKTMLHELMTGRIRTTSLMEV